MARTKAKAKTRITQVPIEKLFISKGNIRTLEVEAEELVPSIRKDGVKKPLNVYPAGDRFGIWDGQRRYLAAKKVGLKSLLCIVYEEIRDEGQAR
ncbi:MAG: ParB/RepB/Spo0J family partition protein, partial [Candidatus Hodarchaeota archaeon]